MIVRLVLDFLELRQPGLAVLVVVQHVQEELAAFFDLVGELLEEIVELLFLRDKLHGRDPPSDSVQVIAHFHGPFNDISEERDPPHYFPNPSKL